MDVFFFFHVFVLFGELTFAGSSSRVDSKKFLGSLSHFTSRLSFECENRGPVPPTLFDVRAQQGSLHVLPRRHQPRQPAHHPALQR